MNKRQNKKQSYNLSKGIIKTPKKYPYKIICSKCKAVNGKTAVLPMHSLYILFEWSKLVTKPKLGEVVNCVTKGCEYGYPVIEKKRLNMDY